MSRWGDAVNITRVLKAMGMAHMKRQSWTEMAQIAASRWGAASGPGLICAKAAQGTGWADALASEGHNLADWFQAVHEREVLHRLPGLRRVAPNVRHLAMTEGSTASFVGQSKAVPVSAIELLGLSLSTKKVASILPATREQLESYSMDTEATLHADMVRAHVAARDAALLDPSNAGDNATPAAITYGAPTSAATDDPSRDFEMLVEQFGGDLESAAWVMHPITATELNLTGNVAFQNLGVRGGELSGLPVLCSKQVPRDSAGGMIALIDGSGIAVAEEAPDLSVTTTGTIEMNTLPTGAADVPTASSSHVVSLFQADAAALLTISRIVWRRVRDDAVSVITGAFYGQSS